jgi:hypothetical protein
MIIYITTFSAYLDKGFDKLVHMGDLLENQYHSRWVQIGDLKIVKIYFNILDGIKGA